MIKAHSSYCILKAVCVFAESFKYDLKRVRNYKSSGEFVTGYLLTLCLHHLLSTKPSLLRLHY